MGKESFLIYKSFYKPISKLSDKQLGKLFRAIFKYQLGEIVTVEEDIEIAFEFFKNQFEMDESKYQGIVERNRNNGSKGGALKRAKSDNPDEVRITQTNPNNPMGFSEPKKADNDNDNDINNSLSNARDGILDGNPVNSNFEQDLNLTECRRELLANQSWINQLSMNVHSVGYSFFTEDVCKEYIGRYFMELQNRGIERKSVSDATSHFSNWLKIELKKQKDNDTRGATAFRTHSGASKQGTEKEARRNGHIPDSTDARKDYSGHF